eukprot:3106748-Pleurochrysis_carterae.AAC.1
MVRKARHAPTQQSGLSEAPQPAATVAKWPLVKGIGALPSGGTYSQICIIRKLTKTKETFLLSYNA